MEYLLIYSIQINTKTSHEAMEEIVERNIDVKLFDVSFRCCNQNIFTKNTLTDYTNTYQLI